MSEFRKSPHHRHSGQGLPIILPEMTLEEAIETTKVPSVTDLMDGRGRGAAFDYHSRYAGSPSTAQLPLT